MIGSIDGSYDRDMLQAGASVRIADSVLCNGAMSLTSRSVSGEVAPPSAADERHAPLLGQTLRPSLLVRETLQCRRTVLAPAAGRVAHEPLLHPAELLSFAVTDSSEAGGDQVVMPSPLPARCAQR